MKILYFTIQISDDHLHTGEKADYMSDLLFHGLRSMLGENVVDFPKKKHMYNTYGDTSGLWGRGFTYSKTLENIQVDREDIERRLQANEFDVVFYTIHHSVQKDYALCEKYLSAMRGLTDKPIVVVDGHDWTDFNSNYFNYTPYFFKREIADDADSRLKPIWFSIPKEKILSNIEHSNQFRIKDFADIVPASHDSPQRKTHSYATEAAYYNDYATSLFAFTSKKGGWDCMRHCEILANGCLPIFTDIEDCPMLTLWKHPKKTYSKIKKNLGLTLSRVNMNSLTYPWQDILEGSCINSNFKSDEYLQIQDLLRAYTKQYLTTEYLAQYVLGEIQ